MVSFTKKCCSDERPMTVGFAARKDDREHADLFRNSAVTPETAHVVLVCRIQGDDAVEIGAFETRKKTIDVA